MERTCTEKYVLCAWVPDDKTDSTLMGYEVNDGLLKVLSKSTFGYLPDLDGAVL